LVCGCGPKARRRRAPVNSANTTASCINAKLELLPMSVCSGGAPMMGANSRRVSIRPCGLP
jgi:hypothetical protein